MGWCVIHLSLDIYGLHPYAGRGFRFVRFLYRSHIHRKYPEKSLKRGFEFGRSKVGVCRNQKQSLP